MNWKRSVWRRVAAALVVIGTCTSGSAAAQQRPASPNETPSNPVVIELGRDGFDWQDAGVGAAATFALVAIGFGLAVIVRNRSDLQSSDVKGERTDAHSAL